MGRSGFLVRIHQRLCCARGTEVIIFIYKVTRPLVWEQDWGADFLRETFRWRYLDTPRTAAPGRLSMNPNASL